MIALLGPNGAGKSTLVELLAGLFVPDEGSIEISGHDLRREPVRALAQIGIVFQQPALDPELTVAANLEFQARLHGMPKSLARERLSEELERLGLGHDAKTPVRQLSGGNRRRVEIARALLTDPAILILDEPTYGLDPAARHSILRHVLDLRRERKVLVLWFTHLIEEAALADRVIVLHKGKIAFDGAASRPLRKPGPWTCRRHSCASPLREKPRFPEYQRVRAVLMSENGKVWRHGRAGHRRMAGKPGAGRTCRCV